MRSRLVSLRFIRPPTILPRRNITTAPLPTRSLRTQLAATILVVGTGFYAFSRVSHAEAQSSKTTPANDDREATARRARKEALESGKAEKNANQQGSTSQDTKPEQQHKSPKPESGADTDSKTGKIKGGHDSDGTPKDEKLKSGKKESKSDKEDKKSEDESDEQDQGEQAFSILLIDC
jgi:hypothetical protein